MERHRHFGFSKNKRLTEKYQFDLVFQTPDFRTSREMIRVKTRKNKYHHARLGIIVAKRQFSHAVTRNSVKRKIRESFRCTGNTLPCVDIVVQVFSFNEWNQFSTSLNAVWQDIVEREKIQNDVGRNS
ncbi:MAG: ribonuclease P protein component [Pseudomonadales bacterium]|nr:ribonuclease P protein component [Pseudomonadales bacterium]